MAEKTDLSGRVFERLTIMQPAPKTWGRTRWWCRCACGRTVSISTKKLVSGNTRSCGCLRRELARSAHTKHGGAYTAEYRIWAGINQRCYRQAYKAFADYGGRGITVCAAWRHDFPAFLRDMGARPSPTHSIDRIDNDGPYSPENCRWATYTEQAAHKRNTRMLELNGVRKPLTVWARDIGMLHASLRERLTSGMTTEDALTKTKRR